MDDNWKLARRKGLGGSDAAAIVGFSRFKTPMDVYLDKTGQAAETADKDRENLLELGKLMEPVIAALYTRETGKQLQQPSPALIHDSRHEFILGTPDRIVAGERGVELKTENQFMDEFGEPGTDQVPYDYLIQCAHYMRLTNMPEWDIALLHAGTRFSIYTIKRDAELEAMLIDELRAWWQKHIVGGVPPVVDGSEAWRTYLRRKYPANILPMRDVTAETFSLINYLAIVRQQIETGENYKAELENKIKLAIGDAEGIAGDFGKITWRKTKDGQSVDWETAFECLANKLGVTAELRAQLIKSFTEVKPGSRRLLFTPRKGWSPYDAIADSENGKLPNDVAALPSGNPESTPETP